MGAMALNEEGTKMLKLRMTACAVVILAGSARSAVADEKYVSRTEACLCTVTVSPAALESSPSWGPSADGPPVSLRQAVDISDALKDSLIKSPKDRKLELRSASLKQSDSPGKWYWLVEYNYRTDSGMGRNL